MSETYFHLKCITKPFLQSAWVELQFTWPQPIPDKWPKSLTAAWQCNKHESCCYPATSSNTSTWHQRVEITSHPKLRVRHWRKDSLATSPASTWQSVITTHMRLPAKHCHHHECHQVNIKFHTKELSSFKSTYPSTDCGYTIIGKALNVLQSTFNVKHERNINTLQPSAYTSRHGQMCLDWMQKRSIQVFCSLLIRLQSHFDLVIGFDTERAATMTPSVFVMGMLTKCKLPTGQGNIWMHTMQFTTSDLDT